MMNQDVRFTCLALKMLPGHTGHSEGSLAK